MEKNIFRDPSRAGLFHFPSAEVENISKTARKADLKVFTADLQQARDRETALAELGRACQFPQWYGANLDALHDCLTDPACLPATACALVICGADGLRSANPEDFTTLVEVLRSAAQIRRDNGAPVWILLDTISLDAPPFPNA